MRLPPEEILQYIEQNRGIDISRDSFAAREYYNPHHMEGKNHPVFYANNGLGDGSHTKLVEINKEIHVVDRAGRAHPDPIPILRSGRDGR